MPALPARLLWLLLLLAARPGGAQAINTDAVTAYWQLTDALRRDELLSDQAWQQFLAIPANHSYVESVYSDDDLRRYRQALEVVYMPRHAAERAARLQSGGWFYKLITNYQEHEAEYRAFIAETVRNPQYLEKMYTYAYEYLPARFQVKVKELPLYYVAIGDDATSQELGLIFSLYNARSYQLVRPGILEAHELHHRLRTGKEFGHVDPADYGLLWMLYMAQNEGLADLTDKRVQLTSATDSAYIRSWLLAPAPRVIHGIDSTVQVLAGGGAAASQKFYSRLTKGSNGHLPGFYMATVIMRNGLTRRMLDTADDPFTFALLYQQAARQDKSSRQPPRFSTSSMRYIKQLARKYAKPRPNPPAK